MAIYNQQYGAVVDPSMQARLAGAGDPYARNGMSPGDPIPGQPANPMAGPPTGLIGSEQALMGGLQGALGGLLGGYGMGRGDIMSQLRGGIGDFRNALRSGNNYFNQGAAALRGAGGQIDSLFDQGIGAGNQYFDQGVQGLQGFIPAGMNAQGIMANYTGANGRDAQQQAYNDFIESPGQAWLREQGERAVTRNAAATGGLGGGRVLQELQRQGQGLAAQDFQNHYGRLAGLSNQGLQAAGQVGALRGQQGSLNASLRGQQAGLQGNLAQSMANLRSNQANFGGMMGQGMAGLRQGAGSQLGNMGMNLGSGIAGMMYGTGQNLAGGRMAVGNQIANRIANTTDNLGTLQNQQGQGISDIVNQGQTNVGNLLTGSGGQNAQLMTQLAQYLMQNNQYGPSLMQGGGQSPGMQWGPNPTQAIGQWGQGIGNLMQYWPTGGNPGGQTSSPPPAYGSW